MLRFCDLIFGFANNKNEQSSRYESKTSMKCYKMTEMMKIKNGTSCCLSHDINLLSLFFFDKFISFNFSTLI